MKEKMHTTTATTNKQNRKLISHRIHAGQKKKKKVSRCLMSVVWRCSGEQCNSEEHRTGGGARKLLRRQTPTPPAAREEGTQGKHKHLCRQLYYFPARPMDNKENGGPACLESVPGGGLYYSAVPGRGETETYRKRDEGRVSGLGVKGGGEG